jgi:hypothetical protein
LLLISWSWAPSRRHWGWASFADGYVFGEHSTPRQDCDRAHNLPRCARVGADRAGHRPYHWVWRYCCRSPNRSRNRMRSPRSLRLKIRLQRGACGRYSRLTLCELRLHHDDTAAYVPLEDFLPMPSLSITSSAHWMRLRSVGEALKRSTPEGAERRKTGCGRTSMVLLPLCATGVAVRLIVAWDDMAVEFDIIVRQQENSDQTLKAQGFENGRGVLYAGTR